MLLILNHLPLAAVSRCMQQSLVRVMVCTGVLLQSAGAWAQAGIDLRNPKPRQLQSAAFTVANATEVRVDATGAEADNDPGPFSWLPRMWSRRDRPADRREPWIGNAWILDLNTR